MAYDRDTVMGKGKGIGFPFNMKAPVGAAGRGNIFNAKGFEKIAKQKMYNVVIVGIDPGRLMSMVDKNRDNAGFYTHRIVQGVGILFFEDKGLVMIPQSLVEPSAGGKAVKNFVESAPVGFDFFKRITLKLLNIAVQDEIPALRIVIPFKQIAYQGAVRQQIVGPASVSHVEIAYDKDLVSLRKVKNRVAV
jgi:hypothetical protein